MNARQKDVLQTLRQAQHFLATDPIGMHAQVAGLRARFDEVVGTVVAHALTQESAGAEGQGDTKRAARLRRELRDYHMRLFVQAARAFFGPRSAEARELRMPRGNAHTEALLAAAGGLRDAAERHLAAFVANGMHPDCLRALDAAIAAVRHASTGRARSAGHRVGATAGLRDALGTATRMLALLDIVLRRELREEQERLAAWSSMSHVRSHTPRGAAVSAERGATAVSPDDAPVQEVADPSPEHVEAPIAGTPLLPARASSRAPAERERPIARGQERGAAGGSWRFWIPRGSRNDRTAA